jgi:malate dehydrogenase (oxaloacetate-decarboxylating)
MRPRVVTPIVPIENHFPHRRRSYKTEARGLAVLNSPFLNKGAAFSEEERASLGLTGLLPPVISTLESQVARAYLQYQKLPDAVSRNIYLTALHDRNEVLFFRLFSEHLREMIPIVNDLTVGMAIEQYHHECRRPPGLYLSIDHPGGIEEAFDNLGAGPDDIDLILATDAEKVPGIGDWGIGAIEVSIGKLAIYTAAGGIDPSRVIPVMLDVGTDRQSLTDDPMYIGNRHARIRGERYDAFIDEYVTIASRLFPRALLQWEDLAPANGRRIHERYRHRICTFNDDMQGTGAIALAAVISAVRVRGTPLRDQRVVIFGAGTAGIGVADQIRGAMVRDGLSKEEATGRFWCVDRQGLLTDAMNSQLGDHQFPYARPAAESRNWKNGGDGKGVGLAEVVRQVRPSILIGTSSVPGAFTEAIVREMAAHTPHPIVFPLSIPAPKAEANPADLLAWTGGRALIATGSLFGPVTHQGVTYVVGQVSNAMLYPGLVLGVTVARASRISDGMFWAAASAVSSLVAVRQPGASLLPHIDNLRTVSMTVAAAVAEAAEAEGLAGAKLGDIVQQVRDAMWQPEYRHVQAV